MATTARRGGLVNGTFRLVNDLYVVITDGIYWIWTTLWGLNKALVRAMLPGQPKSVALMVTFLVVLGEIVALTLIAINWAQTH